MAKTSLGLFFGGRSTEHEISVITAQQVLQNIDSEKYDVTPVYFSKEGDIYTGEKLRDIKNFKDLQSLILSLKRVNVGKYKGSFGLITVGRLPKFKKLDIVFPVFHGANGEDGTIQGLLELNLVPYIGFNTLGSAVGMDKVYLKHLFKSLNLPTLDFLHFNRMQWQENDKKVIDDILSKFSYPIFVKPATLGSSIGVNKATDSHSLRFAIEVALVYSEKVIVEEAVEDVIEVNCSVLGYKDPKASVCEMPVAEKDFLSFADKYQKGGKGSKSSGMASLSRIIPAPISEKLTSDIQKMSVKLFKEMDGCGVARIDFFVDKTNEKILINEINTIPGSLSYYLWRKEGIEFTSLIDKLIEMALERAYEKSKTQYTFPTNVLSGVQLKGIKS